MSRELPPLARLPLLVMGMICLVVAALAGLARLNLEVPAIAQRQLGNHAALMIAGFFGTVISLERAVALRRLWPYLAPLSAGLGGLSLLIQPDSDVSAILFCMSGWGFLMASGLVLRQMPAVFTATLLLGAVCLVVANVQWYLKAEISQIMPFWMGFLVLTIAGERLELTRFLPPKPIGRILFIALLLWQITAMGLILFSVVAGQQLFAAGFFALALWLLRYDIARHTIKQSGLTRFVAVCLVLGYFWLAVGAAMGVAGGFEPGHPWRDAALHAIFLGFVFSMVIGHAPIIFPAVMRVKIPYSPLFYLPLIALHLSLAWRVTGSLSDVWLLRQSGGLINGVSLALFILTLLFTVARAASKRKEVP